MSSSAARIGVRIPKPKRKRLKKRTVPKPDGRYLIYFEKKK